MRFAADDLIQPCGKVLLSEIKVLQPDVIICHGSGKRRWLLKSVLQADFTKDLDETPKREGEGKIVVAYFRHPSRGWLERDLKSGSRQDLIAQTKALLNKHRTKG